MRLTYLLWCTRLPSIQCRTLHLQLSQAEGTRRQIAQQRLGSWSFELLECDTGRIAYRAAIVINEQNIDVVDVSRLLEESAKYVTE